MTFTMTSFTKKVNKKYKFAPKNIACKNLFLNYFLDMDVLPPLFEMDDYNSCLGNNGNYFCSVQGILDFSFQNSSIREFIKVSTLLPAA